MKKKNMSLISFILLIVFLLFTFLPGMYNALLWKSTGGKTGGIYTMIRNDGINMYQGGFIPIFILVFSIIGIIALILQYADKVVDGLNIMTYAPVVVCIAFFINSITTFLTTEQDYGTYHWTYEPGWGFYTDAALILSISVMSILIACGKMQNNGIQRSVAKDETKETVTFDIADEIKKYKELLDIGAITKDEYDEQKKKIFKM